MSSSNQMNTTLHGKPCASCRRRRVRCDRLRPCSNCERSKQLCTYDNEPTISSGTISEGQDVAASADPDLRGRLARLESLMAAMLARDSGGVGLQNESPRDELSGQSPSALISGAVSEPHEPVGQVIFQDGYSAYYSMDFWTSMISEIEDLRKLLSPPCTRNSLSPWFSNAMASFQPHPTADLSFMHPSLEQSNALCKLFAEKVNPFVRIVHQAYFGQALNQYRRGTHILPREFETLLFTIYLLTINCLSSEVVESIFSTSKPVILVRFHEAVQASLSKVNFVTTDKVWVLGAIIHYVTFLFQQSLHQEATALLAVAIRVAQSQGHHRDPSHFPFSPWVCELRRRMWNQICCLDARAITSFGAESCLPVTADSRPPINASDDEWHPSRFAKPSSVPPNSTGFTGMTFALVSREIAGLTQQLAKVDCQEIAAKEALIQQTENSINEKFFKTVDGTNLSQTVVVAMAEVAISNLRLTNRYRQILLAKKDVPSIDKYPVFIAAIELLEAIEYHITTFSPLGWDWIFQHTVPWLAISILLTQLPHCTKDADMERAQRHIDIMFLRYENLSSSRMWKLLVELRHQMQPTWKQNEGPSPEVGTENMMLEENSFVLGFDAEAQNDLFMYDDPLNYQEMANMPWLDPQTLY